MAVAYASHDVVVVPSTWEVSVAGQVIEPEPKVFELLHYLVRNQGRVVTKAELLDSLWSGEVVGESALTRCVSCVRTLLADDPRAPRFIRTVHGRGYEFIGPVVERPITSRDPATLTSSTRTLMPAASSAVEQFVGRTREIKQLWTLLNEIGSSRQRMLLVTGEAGIGKTQLVEHVVQRAQGIAEVHWSKASSTSGAPAFFVWQECFRSIVRQRSMKIVLRAFSDASSGTRRLLLGMDRWQTDENLGWDSPSARFRAFDAIAQGLTELARRGAMILVVDDVHAADLASLLLLEWVVQRVSAPLLVIGMLREGEPIADPERREVLSRIRVSCQPEVALSGLSLDDVKQLITERSDSDVVAARLFQRTGGNPLFVSMLLADGAGGTDHMPVAVRQVVRDRLARLPPECAQLLALAAVHGGQLDTTLLARVSGSSSANTRSALEAASEARLLLPLDPERYRFRHDLVREVLYDRLGTDERSRAHLAVGRALLRVPEYQEARHAAMLANHFAQALDHGGAPLALDLSLRAGAFALRNFAHEEAVQHFLRARDLLTSSPDRDPATECAILLDLGLAQISTGLRETGQETLRLAASKARAIGATEQLASVALGLAPGLFVIETGVYDPTLVAVLRDALDQVGHEDDRLRALLLARLALALYWSDTFSERVKLCDEAERLAAKVGTDDVAAAVTTARVFALLRPSNLDERQRQCETAIELSRRAGDRQSLLINHLLRGAMLLEVGDVAAAAFEADAFRVLAEESREPQALWIVRAQQASRLLLLGRLDEVEHIAGECFAVGQRVGDHNALLTFGVLMALVRIEQGRGGDVLDLMRDYAARYPRIPGWRIFYAYALSRSGQHELCAAEYESLKAQRFTLPDDLIWTFGMTLLSELCHAHADVQSAAVLYDRFAPYAGRLVVVGYAGIACLGSVERQLGLLCATQGRPDRAIKHLEEAVRINRRISATLPLAHTLHDLGMAYLAIGGQYTRDARACREEAETLARKHGFTALLASLLAEDLSRSYS